MPGNIDESMAHADLSAKIQLKGLAGSLYSVEMQEKMNDAVQSTRINHLIFGIV